MDQNSIKLDLLKIKLKDLVSRKIVDMLVKKELPFKQIQEMAVDLTDTLNFIKTKEQLIILVNELANYYPYLKTEAQLMNVELNEIKEQQVIGKLESYFKNSSA